MKTIQLSLICSLLILVFVSWKYPSSPPIKEMSSTDESTVSFCGAYGDYVHDPIDTTRPVAPWLPNLGTLHHPITTSSKRAQEFFDQGLKLCYAFNHKEAHRSFMEVARLDPHCAMAHWGQAFALGSNLNDPINPEREERAYKAVQKALALIENASGAEKDYIIALSSRYKLPPHTERKELNQAFVLAMKDIAEKYPDDADAQELYADALMLTMPWNYWGTKGDYLPAAAEVKNVLEKIIKRFPDHPGAHHSYIHLVEGSNNPSGGLLSANALEALMPQAGHLIHMPSHIYVRTGQYQAVIEHNKRAITADEAYLATCRVEGVYPLRYYPHNIHFLSQAYSFTGQSVKAIQAGNKLVTLVGSSNALQMQRVLGAHYFVYARFGQWNEILTLPKPDDKLLETCIKWHFVRGLAFLRTGNMERTQTEIHILDSLNSLEILKKQFAKYNSLDKVCPVAVNLLKGEFYLSSDAKRALAFLEEAVKQELELIYDEPPVWGLGISARHYLGDAYLKMKMYPEAEKVFKEDLKIYPHNGWALFGLKTALASQNKNQEAAEADKQFKEAWKDADVKINSSIF